jgi:DNA-binding NarL/FixJ family response regulator
MTGSDFAPPAGRPLGPIRVVLTDDHPVVRSGIKSLLERAPDIVVVGEAGAGPEAIAVVESLRPDVLLLDMEMPGMTGVEVAREIMHRIPDMRVLALSAHDDERYIVDVLACGAAGYLTKEEALDTIVDAVRGVARGEEGWLSRRAGARMAARARRDETPGDRLTDREEEVLNRLTKGWSNHAIADDLGVTERTVRFHLRNIYDKMGVNTRSEAISKALTAE